MLIGELHEQVKCFRHLKPPRVEAKKKIRKYFLFLSLHVAKFTLARFSFEV
jgi:hypothetical protein